MANMERLNTEALDANSRFIKNFGSRAANVINREYGEAVDEMFVRLHRQTDGVIYEGEDLKRHLAEIGGGYDRLEFKSKADRDRFVNDMAEQGVDATFAPNKLNGGWLVEIPRSVTADSLKAGSDLAAAVTGSGLSGNDRISSEAIIRNFSERTYVTVDRPTEVQQREESKVSDLQIDPSRYITKHLDELGTVITKTKRFAGELAAFEQTNEQAFVNGRVNSAKSRTAVVLNGDTVLIGGQVVTDDAVRRRVLNQHNLRERRATTGMSAKAADFIITKTDKINQALGKRAATKNTDMHKRTLIQKAFLNGADKKEHPLFETFHEGLGKSVYEVDLYNPQAKSKLESFLIDGDFDTKPQKIIYDKNGEVFGAVYTNSAGKDITVRHVHREHKDIDGKKFLTPVQANTQKIKNAIYRQEYAMAGMTSGFRVSLDNKVKVAEAFKDIALTSASVAVLNKYFTANPAELAKLTTEQINALTTLSTTGRANNLSLRQRADLAKTLEEAADAIRASIENSEYSVVGDEFTEDELNDFNAAIDEVKLSEQEKNQETDKEGNVLKGLIKIDFGLAEIEAVAENLNVEWQTAHALSNVSLGEPLVSFGEGSSRLLFDEITKAGGRGRITLTNEQFSLLKRVQAYPNTSLTALEKYQLNDAIEQYERYAKGVLTDADKAAIQDLKDKLVLREDELVSVKHMTAIENDLGIVATSANFNPDKIMEMNKVLIDRANAAGINIYKREGTKIVIDTDKLKLIQSSPELMKKLGMSKDSLDVAIQINEAQITNPNLLGINGQKVISLVARMDDSGSMQESISAVEHLYTGASYVHSGIVAIRNDALAAKKKRDTKKANKSGYGKKGKPTTKKRKPKKKGEKSKEEKLLYNAKPQKLQEMGAKVKAEESKALAKAAKRERSLAGRYAKLKANVMNRLSETVLGKLLIGAKKVVSKVLIKPIAIGGAVFFLLEGIVIVIVIVLMTISAFLDSINPINIINNALAPETYADTVAYALYDKYLVVKEKEWLTEDLQGFDTMYSGRVDMKYGANYEDFEHYMSHFDDVVLKDEDGNGYVSNIWINPFAESGVSHDGIIHEGYAGHRDTGQYDGTRDVSVGANCSEFGQLHTDADEIYGYSTVESGHTCNIKDILCMTDVMYGMDLSKMSTADFEHDGSLMGKSPEQVDFENVVENVTGWFKWLWNTVKSVFTDTKYEPLKNFCSDKMGMKTIIKYAETLYENSHQQTVALEIQYHKYEPLLIQTSSGAQDVSSSIAQSDASVLGYCVNPVTTKFYLKWNTADSHGNRVSPYFTQYEDGTGTQFVTDLPTTESHYKVQVDMSNYAAAEDQCIKSDMGNNEETYNFIKALADGSNANGTKTHCWTQTKNGEVQDPVTKATTMGVTGGSGYYTRSGDNFTWHDGDGGWYDTEQAAKDAVKQQLQDAYNAATVNEPVWLLSGDRNKFTKTFWEQPAFSVDYNATTNMQRITGWHNETYEVKWWWSEATGTGITTSDKGYGEDWCVRSWDGEHTPSESNGQPVWYATGFRSKADAEAWARDHSDRITTGWWSACQKFENKTKIVSDYSTFYHSSGSCVTVEKKVDEFERNCTGHDFKYCGGHVGMHSHGVVFSITNEQIVLSTVLDETNGNPLADGFDLEAQGYDKMRGKIIHNEVDYSSAQQASVTGGSRSPVFDPQGSISGMDGLNILVSGTEWADGYDIRSKDTFHMMRDIFDIDTNVLKGGNIFPLAADYKKFEGWTDDNMTLVILKWAADWYEEYGFDIPQELWYGELGDRDEDTNVVTPYEYGYDGAGQASLSNDDIEAIVSALQDAYGSRLTESREEAVRLALSFVGKGHYNDKHDDHDFLSEQCSGMTLWHRDANGNEGYTNYDGCCTAGSEENFTNYIRRHFHKLRLHGRTGFDGAYNVPYDSSTILPADTIAHKPQDMLSIPIPDGLTSSISSETVRRLQDASRFKSCVFIGIINNDLELSTGQVIQAGAPIVVDLTRLSADGAYGIGNIYLHGRFGGGSFDSVSFDCYEWLYNDTSRTYYARFE